ncbi:NYN domain-containing protein [Helicobacter macacae]|uniref:NYN domain-containing protein n=1 Tax=Helicobacter macacae MIT 99-5501 TaxID=1357400 RepID=V8C8Y2_9HELI|nr:NYN domain-containing protein [Helicobacter macacae]ETD23527.1 hypothetical protein HMPREF2086_01332 [Helicobacter macacae MIT 99-5501]
MRVNAYIDGYNLYHAERKLNDNRLKWVNLRALCQHFCDEVDILDKVYYFTSFAYQPKGGIKDRHKIYIEDFLEDFGVETIFGRFNKFNGEIKEKETDIKLALQLYKDARDDKYDKAILLSADTDFIPAIKEVKELRKEVLLLLPPTHKLLANFGEVINQNITKDDLAAHLLPAKTKNGKEKMPKEYLSNIQSREQPEEITKNLKYSSWIPKEFTQCEKCKDYLDYERYEKVKPKD